MGGVAYNPYYVKQALYQNLTVMGYIGHRYRLALCIVLGDNGLQI